MIDTGVYQPSNYRNGLQYNFRVDYYRGKDRIYGNLIQKVLASQATIVRKNVQPYDNQAEVNTIQLNWTRTISSNLVSEFGFSYLNMLARNNETVQEASKLPFTLLHAPPEAGQQRAEPPVAAAPAPPMVGEAGMVAPAFAAAPMAQPLAQTASGGPRNRRRLAQMQMPTGAPASAPAVVEAAPSPMGQPLMEAGA